MLLHAASTTPTHFTAFVDQMLLEVSLAREFSGSTIGRTVEVVGNAGIGVLEGINVPKRLIALVTQEQEFIDNLSLKTA